MNHRGPLPLRELHSTDETLAWRDPGGSWACLRPVYHYGWKRNKYTKTALQVAKKGDPEKRKAKEQARAEKANKWTDLRSANCSEDNPSRKELDGSWLVFVKQLCFSYGESPRTPPLEGTSLHRRNISVERPWEILSLFTTCLQLWEKSFRRHAVTCHLHRNWWHAFSEDKAAQYMEY